MTKILTNRRVQVVTGAFIVLGLVFIGGSIGFASVVRSSDDEANSFLRSSISSKLYASDGEQIANLHGEINRDPVPLKDMPLHLRRAAIAIEDRRFYSHHGLDFRGLLRAALTNLRTNSRQGGSTISQQLAKNLYFHGQPRTVTRKLMEVVLTLGLETRTSKDKILEGYLNTAYFGRGAYGVQAAARSYFHKNVGKLTIAESAFLAGLIHRPGHYDFAATDAPEEQQAKNAAALTRRNLVVEAMADLKYISRLDAGLAKTSEITIHAPKDPRYRHPYVVDAVMRELGVWGGRVPDKRFAFMGEDERDRADAVYRGGLRIHTTLDPKVQSNAARALKEQLPPGVLPKLSAAVVTVEPGTGYVRSLIGGRNYYPKGCEDEDVAATKPSCRHAKVNLALGNLAGGSGRQPGSSFKPIVLAAALEDGLSLRQTLDGSPFSYKYDDQVWKVANYEGSAGGTMSIIDATAKSVNAAYGRLEIKFLGDGDGKKGAAKIAAMARKLGIGFPTEAALRAKCGKNYGRNGACTPADAIPAIALGAIEVSPLEMAAAYATFANKGVYARPTFIEKITDASGKVLYEADPKPRRVMSERSALGMSHVLQQVVTRGTGRAAAIDRPVAGKTGTSQMWRDAWFAGYIPQLTSVVWVGNPVPVQEGDGSWTVESMTPSNGYGTRITGGSYPARIWSAHMGPSVEHRPVRTFPAAPKELFKPPKNLGNDKLLDIDGMSGIGATMELRRQGRNVVVHRACPPGGGTRGIQVWKTEERGGETHVWRSRAVCR